MHGRLRIARIDRGLSLLEAAQELGVTLETLRRAERGNSVPHPRNAFRIAQFYGLKPSDIWPLDEDSSQDGRKAKA